MAVICDNLLSKERLSLKILPLRKVKKQVQAGLTLFIQRSHRGSKTIIVQNESFPISFLCSIR